MVALRDRLLELVHPLAIGEELVDGLVLADASTEQDLRLTFEAKGAVVHVQIEPAKPGRPSAASTRRLLFSYRLGERHARVDPALGMRACEAVAALAVRNEDQVLTALADDAARGRAREEDGHKIREVEVDRILESAGSPGERYYTLSPYVGCLIGCRFCYAQRGVGLVREISGLPEVPWGSYVDVRVNAPEVLERELAERPPLPIKFCPIVSDPYHAVEKRLGLTRRCLEVLVRARTGKAVFVLTRSALVERDADLLAALPKGYAGVSIPTIDDDVRAHFEPRGASIEARLGALERLRAAGVTTFAIVQPLLPGSIEELADALAERVASVRIDVLYGVEGAEREFGDPRYGEARDPAWQDARASELARALVDRGVTLWPGELPPELRPHSTG